MPVTLKQQSGYFLDQTAVTHSVRVRFRRCNFWMV